MQSAKFKIFEVAIKSQNHLEILTAPTPLKPEAKLNDNLMTMCAYCISMATFAGRLGASVILGYRLKFMQFPPPILHN